MNRRRMLAALVVFAAAAALWLALAPPRWWLNLIKPVDLSDPVAAGAQLVEQYDCRGCHRVAERGSLKAPDLAGVSQRLDRVSIRLWLRDPGTIRRGTAMPNFRLSDSEIEAIVAYLVLPE